MLTVGSQTIQTCAGLSRRGLLLASAAAAPRVLWPELSQAALEAGPQPRARSVILLWLWGGPSHLDTFDPKPLAPADVRGPFSSIATRTPGISFAETLPRLAARSDRFALCRSNINFPPGHLEAGTLGLSGANELTNPPEPAMGAVLGRVRGYGALPPFVAVGRGPVRDVVGLVTGQGGGRWGSAHDPFRLKCDDLGQVEIPALELLPGQTTAGLSDRVRLRSELDRLQRQADRRIEAWDGGYQRAYELIASPTARQALDLSAESPATRAAFGASSFGQSCLLARRLVEAGVPFIQVNWSSYVEAITPNCDFGWDTHIWNFEMLQDRHGPILDRALSALLDDLQERGLDQSTLVLALGEFGRTPRINGQMARDHWPGCYFSLWAGAGIRAGTVVGRSDPTASAPVTPPVTPRDVAATVLELAGVPLTRRIELAVQANARVVEELLA